MNRETTEFVIYIINEIANSKGLYPSKVYQALSRSGCISDYLVPFYDVLHTMGSNSVVDDVYTYIESKGVSL